MRLYVKYICVVMMIASCSSLGYAQQQGGVPLRSGMTKEEFVENLMRKMTFVEKLGQLNLLTAGDFVTGEAQKTDFAQKIKEGKVGGMFNIHSVHKIREVQEIAVRKSRLGIPLLFGMDVIHGYATTFPIPLGLASTWDMELIKHAAQIAATEARPDGIQWTFSPMVDIARDPRWGRVAEGAGEDAYLGSMVAKAMVEGYQGTSLDKNNSLLACVKHFALYGAAEAGRDYNTVDMSRNTMYNVYFPPYKAAVEAGVGSVMTSFNEIDGIPATANKWLLTEVLRNQWGFKGFVVSDYTSISEMEAHGIGNLSQVSTRALSAGLDMDMMSEGFLNHLQAHESNVLIQQQVDKAVKRILEAKYDVGLFRDPYLHFDEHRTSNKKNKQRFRREAREIAAQSFVLLKNADQVLPLNKSGRIAVVGPLANNRLNMAGTWSIAADHNASIALVEGMQSVVGTKAIIEYAKGSNLDDDSTFEKNATMFGKTLGRDQRTKKSLLDEAIALAKQSDVIVAALGESAEMSGESSSRTQLTIPKAQKDLLDEMLKLGKPVVLVLFTGRPLVLVEEAQKVSAILNVWFPGTEAGLAIADVLFGDKNPSGKLTMTFPRSVGQIPIYYAHKNTGRPLANTDGIFEKFRSNYLDEMNEPLYPFGYGLSYTTFEYDSLKISASSMRPTDTLTIRVDVKNSGNYDGKEVVQLYIRDVVGSITRPVKELKGFQKVFIKKGTRQTVTFKLSVKDLKFYNADLQYIAEPGVFEIFVGTHSQNVLKTQLELLH